MNAIQKKILSYYFKNFFLLMGFSRFVVNWANRSKWGYWYYRIFYMALVRPFYFCRKLEAPEALALIQKQVKIYRTDCICSKMAAQSAEGGCFYVGEAVAIYKEDGPLHGKKIEKQSVRALIEEQKNKQNIFFMTVGQNTYCWFFPAAYVLCFCDKSVCLPWQYQNKIPATKIINPKAKSQNPFWSHLLFLVYSPVLWPPFLSYLYKSMSRRKKMLCEIALLMFIAFTAGVIISDPKMFVYLHNPEWPYNHYWFVLLPIGLWGEIGIIFGGIYLLARKKRRLLDLFRVTIQSFIIFELIQLIRFVSVSYMSAAIEFETADKIFWGFDLPAWILLFVLLFWGYKKTAGKTTVL